MSDAAMDFASNAKRTSLFCKDILQGGAVGLLTMIGAERVIAAPTGVYPFDLTNLPSLSASPMMGAVEILAAAALFFATRRGFARTIGLMGIIAYLWMANSGVGAEMLQATIAEFLESAAKFIKPVMIE
ncbi:MAG: hypothetical protein AAGD92_04180 [Pseudomonadota bacterium]